MNAEQIEQIKVHEFVKQCTDLPFIHIANERKCSAQQGALLKRMGVMAGVSDIFIPRSNGLLHGLFIELKIKSGKVSSHQNLFISNMVAEGYGAMVAYDAEEAILIIKAFYRL